MKNQFILFSLLLLGACRTTAGTKENSNIVKSADTQAEKLLKKIVGGYPEEKDDNQFFECTVMTTDVPDSALVKQWIAELPRTTIKGYHFVATKPSVQILAYQGTEEIVILKDFSHIEQPKEPSTSQRKAIDALTEIANKKCPTPK